MTIVDPGSAAPVACPNRNTVVFQGDGSGMYTPQALWTMAREKADVTMVVMKKDSYAILNIELARAHEGYEGRLAGLRAGTGRSRRGA
ncbi:MAG TPA: thiamine pyrophosphate-dependent enzyme [Anaerolineales bacterium]|nr:thiamine pyrophosphate-dependent enzyme [Anaerolineales bacterium]